MTELERASEVFARALELGGADRDAYLERVRAGEPGVHALVVELLAEQDLTPTIPPPRLVGEEDEGVPPLGKGEKVGRYTVLRLLGAGGMGTVYLAEQDSPKRPVALKLIRPGLATRSVLRRFQQESEYQARLTHDRIARIYEAGIAETGGGRVPYFAMEYVQGVPLDEWVRAENPDRRARLEMLAEIAEAVHHAHESKVIHRDLKPSNILVSPDGKPKILDFGIAKATESETLASRDDTLDGQLIGTVPFMSPEQASGDSVHVDERSDVYALGVVGFVVLTGRLPYDLEGKTTIEQLRVILDEEPAKLGAVDRTLRGDAETIVSKALEKDKSLRYASASGLASDIRRLLADEPILARPPSTWYLFNKFAKRNRPLVGGVAATLGVLLVGVVVSTSLAVIAEDRRVRAQAAEALADARADEAHRALAEVSASAAAAARARGDFEAVKRHCERALSLELEDPAACKMLLLEARVTTDFIGSFGALEEALEDPELSGHRGELTLIEAAYAGIGQGKYFDPYEAYEAAIEQGLPEAKRLLASAMVAPSVAEARDLLERSLELDPVGADARVQLAHLYLIITDYQHLWGVAKAWLLIEPDSPQARWLERVGAMFMFGEDAPATSVSGMDQFALLGAAMARGQEFQRLDPWTPADPDRLGQYESIVEGIRGSLRELSENFGQGPGWVSSPTSGMLPRALADQTGNVARVMFALLRDDDDAARREALMLSPDEPAVYAARYMGLVSTAPDDAARARAALTQGWDKLPVPSRQQAIKNFLGDVRLALRHEPGIVNDAAIGAGLESAVLDYARLRPFEGVVAWNAGYLCVLAGREDLASVIVADWVRSPPPDPRFALEGARRALEERFPGQALFLAAPGALEGEPDGEGGELVARLLGEPQAWLDPTEERLVTIVKARPEIQRLLARPEP